MISITQKRRFLQMERLEARQLLTGSFEGRVWFDVNQDGARNSDDDGEYDITDVEVNLLSPNGQTIATLITNEKGRYEFDNVPNGRYAVEFILPDGTDFTSPNAAGNSRDSDVFPNGVTKIYTLKEGEVQDDVDAGLVLAQPTASLEGIVWEDLNGNGIQEKHETGMSDVEVQLENRHGEKLFEIVTGPNGKYRFEPDQIVPNVYRLDFQNKVNGIKYQVSPVPSISPGGKPSNTASPENGKTPVFVVHSNDLGDQDESIVHDAGLFRATSIRGSVFHDLDRNGRSLGRFEYEVMNTTVHLLDADQELLASTQTDESGEFEFRAVPAGTYFVKFDIGALQSVSPLLSNAVEVQSGEVVKIPEFGVYSNTGTHSVSGMVWEDLNANGFKEPNEPILADHPVHLQNTKFTRLSRFSTDEKGQYDIDGSLLLPGDYVISFAEQNQINETTDLRVSPRRPTDLAKVTNNIQPTTGNTQVLQLRQLVPEQERNTLARNAGFFQLSSIFGMVWEDIDPNGIQQVHERAVGSVEVRLLDQHFNEVDRTFTKNGEYSFAAIYPGTYSIAFGRLEGIHFSSTDGLIHPVRGQSRPFHMHSDARLEIGTGIVGQHEEAKISGIVWRDSNGNGQRDEFETGMPGTLVRLINKEGDVLQTRAADASGVYEFNALETAEYAIAVAPPKQTTLSPFRWTKDSSVDSDVNRWLGRTPYFPMVHGHHQRSIDVGFYDGPISRDSINSIRVTEVGFIGHGNAEFVEIKNVGDQLVDLTDVAFTDGVKFKFENSFSKSIFPGEHAIIVGDHARLEKRFNLDELNVAGIYQGDLDRDERITLTKEADTISSFRYDDSWFIIMDNEYLPWTLTVVDEYDEVTEWQNKSNWRPSSVLAGTPGYDDPKTLPDPGTVVVNEVLPKSVDGENDLIEIHNRGDRDINIGNWFLGDSDQEVDRLIHLTRYQIAPDTVIPAGGFLVLSRLENFGNSTDPGVNYPFGLSSFGEAVHLIAADEFGRMLGYSDSVRFDGSDPNISFGRIKSGSGQDLFVPLAKSSFGQPNEIAPFVGPIIMDQFVSDPQFGTHEYVRLQNTGTEPVDLSSGKYPWQISNAIEFTFEDDALIQPGEHFFVSSEAPELFRRAFGIDPDVQVFGPYDQRLGNSRDDIRLYRYLDDGRPILADQVDYTNSSPWPVHANDTALTRISPTVVGNDSTNWIAGDLKDADLPHRTFAMKFTETATGLYEGFLGFEVFRANHGDANLDRVFDSQDLVQVFRGGKYNQLENANWSEGDWSGDRRFDSSDLVLAFQFGDYVFAARPSQAQNQFASAVDLLFEDMEDDDQKDRKKFHS